jgi:MFS family permease
VTATIDKPPSVLAAVRGTPASVRFLLAGVLVNQLGAFVQTFMVLFLITRGFSVAQSGLAITAYSVGSILGGLLGGELTHRIGPRATITTAMLGSAGFLAAVPLLSRPAMISPLIVTLLLAGLATQSYRPAAAMLLSTLMPAEIRLMGFSMMRIALNLGAALSPLIAAVLIPFDWNLLLWFDAGTALTCAVLARWMLPAVRVEPGRHDAVAPSATGTRSAYRTMLHDGRFWLFLASVALGSIIYVQYTVALPLKIAFEGHPTSLYSTVLITASAVLILCELKITSYVSRWPGHLAATAGTVLMGVGVAGFGVSGGSAVALVACTIVFVFGIMINGPTMFAYPATFPVPVRARYISAHQTTFGAGMAIGPLFGVAAWVNLGDGIWWLCGGIGLLAALCALLGMRPPQQAATAPPEPAPPAGASADGGGSDSPDRRQSPTITAEKKSS